MGSVKKTNKIATDENLMEMAQHGSSQYSFRFYCDDLEQFDFHCIDWHWHTELEILYVESGSLTCYVGDKQIILKKGEGMFINSRVLHRFHAESAIMPNFVFMPSFIREQDSLIYQKYVLPVISSSLSFQVFHAEVSWQNEVLKLIGQIIEIQKQEIPCELATSALIQMLWLLLYENAAILPAKKAGKEKASSQARLQLMMQYVYLQYQNPISLEEIAGAASISKSTALNLFKEYLHVTPVEFLIQHRFKTSYCQETSA